MNSAKIPDGGWVHLNNRAIFRISGPDRIRFLNGQVTNDVAGPLQRKAIGACLCSLKGKVEFLVWISADEEALFVDGQLNQRKELAERLDRYLIADDCEISDMTEELTLIHHFDRNAEGIHSTRSDQEGFDCYLKNGEMPFAPEAEIRLDDFSARQAKALIPEYPTEITGSEFPAELGIDQWAVDFHKGCYLGQEVISRIKSVGKVKRSLILACAETQLDQDSKVRTATGGEGRVTRVIQGDEEKNSLFICFVKEAPKSPQTLVPQRVDPCDDHVQGS